MGFFRYAPDTNFWEMKKMQNTRTNNSLRAVTDYAELNDTFLGATLVQTDLSDNSHIYTYQLRNGLLLEVKYGTKHGPAFIYL